MRKLLALVLVPAALLAACSGSAHRTPFLLGSLYPRTGPQGAGGTEEASGAELAVDWANGHGGVGGRPVRLVPVDAPRAEAVPDAIETLRRHGVGVVVGTHGSTLSAVAADVATRDGMVLWETGAVGQTTDHVAGGHNFFRMAPMGANLGRSAIAFMRDEVTPRLATGRDLRYAVAYVDDPYGRAVGLGAVDEINTTGRVLAGSVAYDAHATDFGPVAARIAALRPDVLFVAAYLDDGVALRRATVAAGVPVVAGIGTSSSYCMPAFGDRLGDQAVGLFASDKPDAADVRPDALRPEGRRALAWAIARYRARHHAAMSAHALAGFANTYALLVHVLPAARGTSPDAIAAAALATKLAPGTLANGGGLDLAAPGAPDAGENRAAASVIWEWVAPRTRAVVWPPAYATHAIVTPALVGA